MLGKKVRDGCLCWVLLVLWPGLLAAEEIFVNGFESGDLSAWSSFQPPLATTILSTSPLPAETAVALTRETIFVFEAPIDASSLTSMAVRAETDGGLELAAGLHLSADGRRVTLFYDPPLPAGNRIRVVVDGDLLRNANGQNVDANGNGHPGGRRTLEFTTLGLATQPGTRVCGRVLASEPAMDGSDVPLVGVTVSVDGLEATYSAQTDAMGNYCLDPSPSDRFFVHIDGSTATNTVPEGAYYPTVGKAFVPKPGLTYHVGESFLPLIADGTLQPVSTTEDTMIALPASVLAARPELAGSELLVPAGSLFSNDGLPGTNAGLAPVPSDRLPGNLPSDLDFPVVFTVQTDGATNFDTPAPICFPNLVQPATGEILPAGATQSLVSFDHDAGRWRAVGGMTVDAMAERICSDPGVGIEAPGWHLPSPPPVDPPPPPVPPPPPGPNPPHPDPPPTPDPPTDPPEPQDPPDDPCPETAAGCHNRCQAVADSNACAYTMLGAGLACGLATLTLNPIIGLVVCGGALGVVGIEACSAVNESCSEACNSKCGGSARFASWQRGAFGDPVLDELASLSDQIMALIEPYRQSTDPLPEKVRTQVADLLDQADVVAGGDAIAYLQSSAAAAWPEVETAMPSGNAPHYPILYLAEYRRGDDTLIQRGETGPYGQFTLFPALRADLLRIRFYDPHTHSVGMQFPVDLGAGAYGLTRLYLRPVDDATFPDLDGDTLADEIEHIYGTNLTLVDTDGDGASDRDEIIAGTDPLGRDIEVGEVVADLLAVPGEIDRYTLAALAGQTLFFDIQSGAGGGKDWSFLDPEGETVFDTTFSGDIGNLGLTRGGNYTLLLGDDSGAATGSYQFQLWDVPAPDTFGISIGDVISNGVPGAGAGNIETPGVFDIYTFTASAGQDVFFDIQAGATGSIDWTLTDSAETTLFETFLGADRGVVTLELGGTYTLVVGSPDNDHMGSYQFQLWDVPAPDTFGISIGDVISNGVPGAGAGNIETPGVFDIYTFTASAGQTVLFDIQSGASGGLDWRLEGPEGTVFDRSFSGDRTETLAGGSYTLTIGNADNDQVGTYQLALVPQ